MPMKNPPHPGRHVKATLDALELSLDQGADALGMASAELGALVRGESPLTAETAVRLEAVIGSTADHWLRLQAAYDLAQVRNSEVNPAFGLKRRDIASDTAA